MIPADAIRDARERISPYIIQTPLMYSPTFSAMTGAEIYLKLETFQKGGSFKIRGAVNKIRLNLSATRKKGVITASAGNHAQGVAIAARDVGISATVIMPMWASLSKQEATRGYGAEVHLYGSTLEESIAYAHELAADGRLYIHPFDDLEVIAGQGTVGLEICDLLKTPDVIVVPVGGGGLISGIATAVHATVPSCAIIGVQARACPSAYEALSCNGPVTQETGWTIADGIRVAETGRLTYPVIRDEVRSIILVDDADISDAMVWLLERMKVVAEGAGAAPLAALLTGAVHYKPGDTVVLVISGGNVDSHQYSRIIRQALVSQERLMRLSVVLEDKPGSLAELLAIIAREGGNILHIHHSEWETDIPVNMKRIRIEIETRGHDHSHLMRTAVMHAGIRLSPHDHSRF